MSGAVRRWMGHSQPLVRVLGWCGSAGWRAAQEAGGVPWPLRRVLLSDELDRREPRRGVRVQPGLMARLSSPAAVSHHRAAQHSAAQRSTGRLPLSPHGPGFYTIPTCPPAWQLTDITQWGDPREVARLLLPPGAVVSEVTSTTVPRPPKQGPFGPIERDPFTIYRWEHKEPPSPPCFRLWPCMAKPGLW